MPELPEVETMRRGVLAVAGSTICRVQRVRCRLKPICLWPSVETIRRRAVGRKIEEVGRVGKRVLLLLDSGDRLLFEPRMTGLVLLHGPPDPAHLRFRLLLEGGAADQLCYWDRRGLGSVKLLSPAEFSQQLGESRLGPDALSVTADVLRQRLAASRRAVKVALLDQRVVAGIGNLYASEILHAARLHPARRCDRLRRAQWQRIQQATQEILQEAVRCEGSTLSDGTYRTALFNPGGYQSQHRVYDRAGQLCLTCGKTAILRIVQAQRSTFFCPVWQPP